MIVFDEQYSCCNDTTIGESRGHKRHPAKGPDLTYKFFGAQGRTQDLVKGGPNYGQPKFANVVQQSCTSEASLQGHGVWDPP